MPRFQLLIRELGKAPRSEPLARTIVVGRSRRADLVVEDEEVGREQFRIGIDGADVFLEGIGKTNKTLVDGAVIEPGQRVPLMVGAHIKIGRTQLTLQVGEPTHDGPLPGSMDATMIAPARPGQPPTAGDERPLPRQEQTGGFRGPAAAAGASPPPPPAPPPSPPATPPAAPPPPAAGDDDFGQTMSWKGKYRPGYSPSPAPGGATRPPTPPDPATGGDDGRTLNFRPGQVGGAPPPAAPAPAPLPAPPPALPADDLGDGRTINFRPGAAPPRATPPTAALDTPDVTRNLGGAFRPGRPDATQPPAPPPPAVPPAPPADPAPAAGAATPTPAPAAASGDVVRAKTMMVGATPVKTDPIALAAADVEARLHQATPRLFVKGDTLRRRVRLMKTKTKVGRAETADVLLPNESVSELHAELEFDGAAWLVRDCGSTNGTTVDGAVLRNATQAIARNTVLGFGNLRGVFLCNDPARTAADRRLEERALQQLVVAGKLQKDVARQVRTLARRDTTQAIVEILLGETPVEPADWGLAVAAARARVTLFDRLRALFGRKP